MNNNIPPSIYQFADFVMTIYPEQVREWSQDDSNPELKTACQKLLRIARK